MISAGGCYPVPGTTPWYWALVVWQGNGPISGTYTTEYEHLVSECRQSPRKATV